MRPRFRLRVPDPPEQVVERFRERLACAGCPCALTVLDRHLEVRIHDRLRHFWSPHLTVEISPADDGASELSGLFGPNPSVWTLFLAGYAVLILSAVFAGLLGASQLLVATGPPWGLWVAAGCAIGLVIPYTGSLIGQRLAADQMEMLRCFLNASLALPDGGTIPAPCVAEGLKPEPESPSRGTKLPVIS